MTVAASVQSRSIAARLGILADDRFVLVQGQAPQPSFDLAKFANGLRTEKVMKIAVLRLDKVQNLELQADKISVPERGDFADLMKFIGVSTLACPMCPIVSLRALVSFNPHFVFNW